MSHITGSNLVGKDDSGFNYPSAAGLKTNSDVQIVGLTPSTIDPVTLSSTSVTSAETVTLTPHIIDPNHGKLGSGEHGGAGTRADDRQGQNVKQTGDTLTPVASQAGL